jgi:hypothetical protein
MSEAKEVRVETLPAVSTVEEAPVVIEETKAPVEEPVTSDPRKHYRAE